MKEQTGVRLSKLRLDQERFLVQFDQENGSGILDISIFSIKYNSTKYPPSLYYVVDPFIRKQDHIF
jgi:hypothetical protein